MVDGLWLMSTISILANTVRPSVNCRLDDTAFGAGRFSRQDTVRSWKAGPGEVMTRKLNFYFVRPFKYVKLLILK